MIKLAKGDEPAVLVDNKATWTAEFAANSKSRKYAHDDVREALRVETHSKCAYCESHMLHVSSDHIEHIKPKSMYKELVCEWANLTVACEQCNTKKGTYDVPACPLLNPYVDNLDQHLTWIGPMVWPLSPDRGKATFERLDLNRSPLLYKRAQVLSRAKELLERIEASPPAIAAALGEELARMQQDSAEYAAAVRALVVAA